MKTVGELMTKNVATVDAESSVVQAVGIMKERGIGAIVVAEGSKVTGIFTERDLINLFCRFASDGNLGGLKIKDFMTKSPVTAGPGQIAVELIEAMQKNRIRHMPILENGDIVGIISSRDLIEEEAKELKEANERQKESTAQLIQSAKLSVIGEMTAGVAHELNQPLNVTKIVCQSMLQDINKDRFDVKTAKEDIPEIINQMSRMASIIDHMRIFARRTEGNVLEDVDINTTVENVFIFMGQQLKTHNIEVVKELGKDMPIFKGDQIRLEQVFINLITNARHATEKSGKPDKRIEIKTYCDNNTVIAEFKDNGTGIPEEIREKIFESFFTTKEKGKGAGMGLSVAKKIIDEHHGRLEVDSVAGEWSAFKVVLPVT